MYVCMCVCAWMCVCGLNRIYFLEQYQGDRRIEQKAQRFLIFPIYSPTGTVSPPKYPLPWCLLSSIHVPTLMNHHQSHSPYWGSLLVKYSLRIWKAVQWQVPINHCIITQQSDTAPNSFAIQLFILLLPQPLGTSNPLTLPWPLVKNVSWLGAHSVESIQTGSFHFLKCISAPTITFHCLIAPSFPELSNTPFFRHITVIHAYLWYHTLW
jgi:hypothetical protein